MKKLLLALLLAALGCSSTTVEETVKAPVVTVKPKVEPKEVKIDWQPFSDDVVKASVALGKPIFLYLKDDKCGFCNQMSKNTFSNPIIIDIINKKFIPTKIDVRKNTDTARMFYKNDPYISVPKTVFIRVSDHRFIVAEATGYLDPFEMIETIEEAEKFLNRKLNESNADKKGSGEHQGVPAK